jgi:3-isopropylmalate/(R)-2-methylmalate dehydratase large subunit
LHAIGRLGTAAGAGYAVEYAGSAMRALEIDGAAAVARSGPQWP